MSDSMWRIGNTVLAFAKWKGTYLTGTILGLPDPEHVHIQFDDGEERTFARERVWVRGDAAPEDKYPRGKLTEDDEGEIKLGIAVSGGTVILAFGGPVTWVGMGPEQARHVGELLVLNADKAEKHHH